MQPVDNPIDDLAQPASSTSNGVTPLSECQQHYERLYEISASIMRESFDKDAKSSIASSHSFIADLKLWEEALSSRPELPVFQAAIREYQFAILALLQGHYRYSFVSLRLFFEMALATVRFSAHEIEFRLWARGEHDIKWGAIVEKEPTDKLGNTKPDAPTETGMGNTIFSKQFVRAFGGEAFAEEAAHYRSIATKVYRECSEFVHGNSHTHTSVPASLAYSPEIVEDWLTRAESIKLVVVFALCARYIKYIPSPALSKLELAITDTLGHLPAIRGLFGATTES